MSSTAHKSPPPSLSAEWRKLHQDLKRTQAQLAGQMRRLEALLAQAATVVAEAEKREQGKHSTSPPKSQSGL